MGCCEEVAFLDNRQQRSANLYESLPVTGREYSVVWLMRRGRRMNSPLYEAPVVADACHPILSSLFKT